MADPIVVHDFPGGLHLDGHKAESNGTPIRDLGLPLLAVNRSYRHDQE